MSMVNAIDKIGMQTFYGWFAFCAIALSAVLSADDKQYAEEIAR